MNVEEEVWNGEQTEQAFQRFAEARNPVLRATQRLFEDFYKENFAGGEQVLEIGAGLGFLKSNWPKNYSGNWIQLDLEESLLAQASGSKLIGSAYDLPIASGGVDVVCGYGSFDVFHNLEKAVEEARRVLTDDGIFFHFLDLVPNREAIIADLQRENRMVIPGDLGLIQLIPNEKIQEYEDALEKHSKMSWDDEEKKSRGQLRMVYGEWVDQPEYFRNRLVKALQTKFEHVNSGQMIAQFTGPKTRHHQQDHHDNQFGLLSGSIKTHFFDGLYSDLAKNLPRGYCLEVSQIDYVLAKKPKG